MHKKSRFKKPIRIKIQKPYKDKKTQVTTCLQYSKKGTSKLCLGDGAIFKLFNLLFSKAHKYEYFQHKRFNTWWSKVNFWQASLSLCEASVSLKPAWPYQGRSAFMAF